jgi:hypothetical protein
MTPGGIDAVISTSHPVELMELAVRWLFVRWQHGVVSDAEGARLWFPQSYYRIPFAESTELFVYSTQAAFVEAKEDLPTADWIHLLRTSGELTVVRDEASRVGEELVDMLRATKFPGDV